MAGVSCGAVALGLATCGVFGGIFFFFFDTRATLLLFGVGLFAGALLVFAIYRSICLERHNVSFGGGIDDHDVGFDRYLKEIYVQLSLAQAQLSSASAGQLMSDPMTSVAFSLFI